MVVGGQASDKPNRTRACRKGKCLFMALSGYSADRVDTSGSGRKADMPNQRVECPLMTLSGYSACGTSRAMRGSRIRSRESYAYLGTSAQSTVTWASPDVGQNFLHQPTLVSAYVYANLAWPLFWRFALSGTATDDDFGLFVGRLRLR